eukprot:12399214-Karenia_brevis.AAC.1
MERAEGRRRVEEADERMKRMRELQQNRTEESAKHQKNESEPATSDSQRKTDQDVEDIGGDIDLEKWEKFQKSAKSKRSTEGGEE